MIILAPSVIGYTWRDHEFQAIYERDLCKKPALKRDFEAPWGAHNSVRIFSLVCCFPLHYQNNKKEPVN